MSRPLPAGAFGSGLQHPRDVGAARSLKVLPKRHAINGEASRGIVTHRPYNAAPPPATDWDAPAPYKAPARGLCLEEVFYDGEWSESSG